MAVKVLDESLRGKLMGFDQHMNLILDSSEEFGEESNKTLGTIVVRGDNVIMISPPPGE